MHASSVVDGRRMLHPGDRTAVRVLIADDHSLFRQGLRALLEARGFDVVGEAGTGVQAIELSLSLRPDVVLMDLAMPELGGLAATRLLSVRQPDVKVVVLTASDEETDVFEAIKSGAYGYLKKDLSGAEFARCMQALARGEPMISPSGARKLLGEFSTDRSGAEPASRPESLTDREHEVLQLLVQGVTTTQELSAQLVVSDNTVKFHLRNILDKLHVHNRAEVVAYASRYGLGAGP
jgi:DNA-binding NarL/FixJ family response regulator